MKKYLLTLGIFTCFFGVLTLLVTIAENDAKQIRDSVLRFHIVANSDSDSDQQNKMAVRDGMAELCSELFYGAENKKDAIKTVLENSSIIEAEANRVLINNGCDDEVFVTVRKRVFPTRYYDGVSLPAGVYDTVDVMIGEGQGKNFWCVMFPDICVGASMKQTGEQKMSEILTGDSLEMATGSKKPAVRLKFRTVELFESFVNFFR